MSAIHQLTHQHQLRLSPPTGCKSVKAWGRAEGKLGGRHHASWKSLNGMSSPPPPKHTHSTTTTTTTTKFEHSRAEALYFVFGAFRRHECTFHLLASLRQSAAAMRHVTRMRNRSRTQPREPPPRRHAGPTESPPPTRLALSRPGLRRATRDGSGQRSATW